jgi:hypothetical protein
LRVKLGAGRHDAEQRADHVGVVVAVGDDEVQVQWEGPEAPPTPSRYGPRVLERADY